jgi:hypothetical protein
MEDQNLNSIPSETAFLNRTVGLIGAAPTSASRRYAISASSGDAISRMDLGLPTF